MTRALAVWTACTATVLSAATAFAQLTPPPAPTSPTQAAGRSLFFEVMIVIAMLGLSLYVVCRSSRRN